MTRVSALAPGVATTDANTATASMMRFVNQPVANACRRMGMAEIIRQPDILRPSHAHADGRAPDTSGPMARQTEQSAASLFGVGSAARKFS